MKIGILSDTHNHLAHLIAALKIFQDEKAQVLIHCGDMTSPETAAHFHSLRVIHVIGNGDLNFLGIRQQLLKNHANSWSGEVFSGVIGPAQIAAAHGHDPAQLDSLIRSGHYQYVFTGHSHRRRDVQIGSTRVINPGALGGLSREERSICVLNLETNDAQFFTVQALPFTPR